MLKILIAVDGSEHANRAIEAVGKMARSSLELQAILICVRSGAILEPLFSEDYAVSTIRKLDTDQEKQQAAVLASAKEHAKAQGINVTDTVQAYGVVTNEILRIAKDWQIDQIAMGTRGMGAVGSIFMGSVAQRVVHHSPVPVLLAK